MLQVIPVIDLRQGQVVHARRGDRANYQPVRSLLCQGAEPAAVIAGLLSLHDFRTLYVADLDAIQARGDHRALIERLRAAFPALEFWVDAALHEAASLVAWRQAGLGRPIVGAESLPDGGALARIAAALSAEDWILSLDFRTDVFLGPTAVLERNELWPRDVIAMNLAKVGSGEGPDVELLHRLAARAGGRRIHAAGGVRHLADLRVAQEAGADGALVATALHDGRLGAADLRALR